jgi:hypothetical protein
MKVALKTLFALFPALWLTFVFAISVAVLMIGLLDPVHPDIHFSPIQG